MQLSPQGRRPFYLSPHFTLQEMLESETAERLEIDNSIKIPPSVGGGSEPSPEPVEGGELTEGDCSRNMTSPASQARHPLQKGELIVANLKALCLRVLEPLREAYGKPIHINSGYRSHRLNYIIGGSPTSQHLKGQACDLVGATHGDLIKLFNLIQSLGLPFDQLIAEKFDPRKEKMPATKASAGSAPRGWIHVSYRADGKNRKQILYR